MEGYREIARTDLDDAQGNRLSVVLATNGKAWVRYVVFTPESRPSQTGLMTHCPSEELGQEVYRDQVAQSLALGWVPCSGR